MSWGRMLLLGNVGQQIDIEDIEEDVARLRARIHVQQTADSSQDAALLALRREVTDLQLVVTELARIAIRRHRSARSARTPRSMPASRTPHTSWEPMDYRRYERAFLSATVVLAALGAGSRIAAAQACTPPAHPAFEFQVDRPAAYAGDTTGVPRPTRSPVRDVRARPELLLVQFVVDTLGVPDPRSFKVLQRPSVAAADSARVALAEWRFTPAMLRGCRVPQLVQTVVTR